MTYREFRPPIGLSNVIECVWTRLPDSNSTASEMVSPSAPVAHAILPDGAMDVIATFFADGEIDEAFVVGSMTRPQLATLGDHPLIGIRFLPGVGGSALGANAATFTDDQVDIRDVFARTDSVRDALRALRLDSGSAHALHLFAQSIGMEKRGVPPVVRHATKLLGQRKANVRVENIAKEMGITRQHLTRVFSSHAGLTPKLFAQICRVRALLSAAQRSTDSWSMLAAEFGYADQSHLIAEVSAIIGQTPAAWRAECGSNIPIVPVPVGPL